MFFWIWYRIEDLSVVCEELDKAFDSVWDVVDINDEQRRPYDTPLWHSRYDIIPGWFGAIDHYTLSSVVEETLDSFCGLTSYAIAPDFVDQTDMGMLSNASAESK